ncbi:hypothetical protein IB292_02065 [Vibrio parahaemolyticus]|uniref:DUF945 domain-containing protein n=1 Tax=Vibrio parahaemolyticus TaxID=670 RepID=A0A9Q3U9K4_VIBPH|nr:hypothetical protein [Vibrio parahaemolyticus]MCC3803813.1 hypothetical protein [Vibrio parahaemolyticus]
MKNNIFEKAGKAASIFKSKKALAASIAIALIGTGYGAKEYVLSTYNSALENTPLVSEAISGYAFNNGNLFIESIITDHAGFEWQSISKVDIAQDGIGLSLTSKAFAIDEATSKEYTNWLSAKNNSLNAIAETTITNNGLHSDVRFKPVSLNTPSGLITIPETAVIYDAELGSSKSSIVIAALGNVNVEAVGNNATFIKPRLKYQPETSSKQVHYSARFEGVNVGLVEVSKATEIDIVILPQKNNLFNLGVDANIEQLSNVKNIKSRLLLSNLDEKSLAELTNAAVTAFSTDLASKVKNLTALFNYAKVGGSAKLDITGEDLKGTGLLVDAKLGFDEDFRQGITTENAFSILDSAQLDAKVSLPVELATSLTGPVWMSTFINDGMALLVDDQVQTEISIRNMDAVVNGKTLSL